MTERIEVFVKKILNTYRKVFSVQDLVKYLEKNGITLTQGELAQYLEQSPLVFPLEGNLYITKAGVFTGMLFSIKPTSTECDQGAFAVGSRCMPFLNSESCFDYSFFCEEHPLLETKVIKVSSDLAIDIFGQYGEEYAPQYIAADPANAFLHLEENDFQLPAEVYLTALDMSYLVEHCAFKKGDRLLCYVTDWCSGLVNIKVIHEGDDVFGTGAVARAREKWYQNLEEGLLKIFDKMGPCSSIEEQLADVFFENKKALNVPSCGSVQEYLEKYAKKVSASEYFGVETRLWKKGESVPAVGAWNMKDLEMFEEHFKSYSEEGKWQTFSYSHPDYILDQYIFNMLFERSKENDLNALLDKIYPEDYCISDSDRKALLLNLTRRHDTIQPTYNWFADQEEGPVRKKALEVYSEVSLLVFKIDRSGCSLALYPQQELVILSQLYSHITRMLEEIDSCGCSGEEARTILSSLEGMKWNFEEIAGPLEAVLEKHHLKGFKVIK